ncbi:MAG: toll/interleukin-1 receptor domain-containing protein [Deltaproteobacteria bacterium]
MGSIFVSYRRTDSAAGYSRSLANELALVFGDRKVFRDVKNIPPGVDFGRHIRAVLARSAVLLVVLGDRWASEKDDVGAQRLMDPNDWVRQELREALSRGIPVVPVLVAGASMPKREELPEDIQGLVDRNAAHLSDKHWERDVEALISEIAGLPGTPRARRSAPPRRWRRVLFGGIAVAAMATVLVSKQSDPTRLRTAREDVAESTRPRNDRADISGTWRDSHGNLTVVEQQGSYVTFVSHTPHGAAVAEGTGKLDGVVLEFRLLNVLGLVSRGRLVLGSGGNRMEGTINHATGSEAIALMRQ